MIAAQSHCVQVHEQYGRAAVSSPGIQPIPAVIEVGDYQAGQGRQGRQGTRPHGRPVAPSLSGLGPTTDRTTIFLFFFSFCLYYLVYLCLAELWWAGTKPSTFYYCMCDIEVLGGLDRDTCTFCSRVFCGVYFTAVGWDFYRVMTITAAGLMFESLIHAWACA